MEQPFDFGWIRLGILPTNALAREITSEIVQVQRDGQPLLTRHSPVMFDLTIQGDCRGHDMLTVRKAFLVIRPSACVPPTPRIRRAAREDTLPKLPSSVILSLWEFKYIGRLSAPRQ